MAVEACTACLKEEPYNLKARARRFLANRGLGRTEEARADLAFILSIRDEQVSGADRGDLDSARRLARRELGKLPALPQQTKR